MPMIVFAQKGTLGGVLTTLSQLLNGLIGVLITVALLVFFWGLIRYLLNMSSEDAHKGIQLMIWGIAAVFVMVSIWGIILLLQRTFGVEANRPLYPETIPLGATAR